MSLTFGRNDLLLVLAIPLFPIALLALVAAGCTPPSTDARPAPGTRSEVLSSMGFGLIDDGDPATASGTLAATFDAPKGDHVAKGKLIITSKPSDAEVFIDGTKLGKRTPLEEMVIAGPHRITVKSKTGEQTFALDVVDGSVTKRNITLE